CSAIDNFGKFSVGSTDMAGGCTPGCTCIPADSGLGVPDHCALAPSNGISCTGLPKSAGTVTVSAGTYTIDSGASTPIMTDPSSNTVRPGSVAGNTAFFCIGSWVAAGGGRIVFTGNRPVAIVADSLIRHTNGAWILAGSYATDANGAAGVAGGTAGGSGGND